MVVVRGLTLLLILSVVVPIFSLICYECGCEQENIGLCNCQEISEEFGNDYCVIAEQRFEDATYIQLTRIPRNSTYIYIEDTYFILFQETIKRNATSTEWNSITTGALFGCDWDYCNSPHLIYEVPSSLKFTMSKSWLDENIYGTGSTNQCHQCAFEECSDASNPIDFSKCPLTTCVNVTSCLVYDLWTDFDSGDQCYASQCAPSYLDTETDEILGGKYKINLEAVVYLAQDRSQYDMWEIDVYCAAPNCTRPTIFQEILNELDYEIVDLAPFPTVRPSTTTRGPTTTTPIENPLVCYSCACISTTECPCTSTVVTSLDETYCVIGRENFGQEVFINFGYIDYDATFVYILDAPFTLVENSIGYDEKLLVWLTTTNFVLYGCNWNLCNKPGLLPLLPNSFQMRLPEAWLNTNILGSGQPVRNCHECPMGPECGTAEFLNSTLCPIQPCNTTCLVSDSFNDPAFEFLCYDSFCIPPDADEYNINHHRVEIEGVIYASDPRDVKIWEIDLYCRADDCSRPEIFKELRQQLSVQVGTLDALFNETHDPNIPQRRCYDCWCYNEYDCGCERVTLKSANSSYCLIILEDYGQDFWVTMGHIDNTWTQNSIRDFPYLLVEEAILYSEVTGVWNTITNYVIFGCNWDYCNDPSLGRALPRTFQMRLPEAWLNTSILGTGQPVRDCHECPEAPQCGTTDFLDAGRCPIKECNTTCIVSDSFDDPATGELCYQSFCAPPDSEFWAIDAHRVEIEGILYLDKVPRTVELWEIDIFCRADDCSRPDLFKELQANLYLEIGDLSAFDSLTTTTTMTSASTRTSIGTTPSPTGSTPPPTGSTPPPTGTTPPPTGSTQPVTTTTTSKASTFTINSLFSVLIITTLLLKYY